LKITGLFNGIGLARELLTLISEGKKMEKPNAMPQAEIRTKEACIGRRVRKF
jgi:hypothetical protein